MADVNRLPVDCFVLHHAVTPLWPEKSKAQLAQWFSDNGFARAYGSNAANWSGLINPYTGGRSYSQAHIAGQQVTSATPDATADERAMGFRWVPLVNDIWGQITWHAGNWEMNRKSIGIEMLGDYRNYTLRDFDCRVLGAFWRPQDLKFGGATAIFGHLEVSDAATACPARIMEKRDTVVGYCNNPPHAPVITTKDTTATTPILFTTAYTDDPLMLVGTQQTLVKGVNGTRTVITRTTYSDGVKTGSAVISDKTIPPVTEQIFRGTMTTTTTTTTTSTTTTTVVPPITPIETLWQRFVAWFLRLIGR